MPDRRGRKGSTDDFFPADILPWARETWRDREEVAKLPNGAWMLRRAACVRILGTSTSPHLPFFVPVFRTANGVLPFFKLQISRFWGGVL